MAKLDAKTRAQLDSITEEQWIEHYNELVVYAVWKCRRLYWRTRGLDNLPGTFTPDAIVREAVALLFGADRTWNRERYPTVVDFLKSVIDSKVSSLVNGEEHKLAVYLEDERTRRVGDAETYEVEVRGSEDVPDLSRHEPLSPELDAYFGEIEQRIRTVIEDRQDLVAFFGHLQEGHSPAEISRLMKVPPDTVYQLRKLFDARTVEIKNELIRGKALIMKAKGDE